MKTASISSGRMPPMHSSHHAHKPMLAAIRHALQRFSKRLARMQIAIALSEAGDMEGARSLLTQPLRLAKAKSKP